MKKASTAHVAVALTIRAAVVFVALMSVLAVIGQMSLATALVSAVAAVIFSVAAYFVI